MAKIGNMSPTTPT